MIRAIATTADLKANQEVQVYERGLPLAQNGHIHGNSVAR
jgi:hypothetical protein